MHTWQTFAFLCACAACIIAAVEKAWAIALIAASLALALVPVVFTVT